MTQMHHGIIGIKTVRMSAQRFAVHGLWNTMDGESDSVIILSCKLLEGKFCVN